MVTNIRLKEDTKQRLEALGKARDRSPHYLMKIAIERYLEEEEAFEAERQLALDRWEKFEVTGETVDHAEVVEWASALSRSKAAVD